MLNVEFSGFTRWKEERIMTNQKHPAVEFEASEWGDAVRVDQPSIESLMDLCDEIGAPVPFSCRGASCSTCRIEVLEGQEWLEAPNAFERELIDSFKTPASTRFACQVALKELVPSGDNPPPRVRIRALGAIED